MRQTPVTNDSMNRGERVSEPVDVDRVFGPMLDAIARRWRVILGTGVLAALVAGAVILLLPRSYSSQSAFVTQSRRSSSTLSGLAAQFGLNMPVAEASQSPQFYADFVRSRPVLASAASRTYQVAAGGITVAQMYGIEKSDSAQTEFAVVERLGRQVEAAASVRTGVVRLRTRLRSAEAAQQLNQTLLELLNRFNMETRQSQAGAERAFAEQRYSDASARLRTSEAELLRFYQRNRDIRHSPELQFEADRLQRVVAMDQDVATSLLQALEQARIEEVRDTPLITVIEPPSMAARPDSRGVVPAVAVAFLFGTVLGVLIVVVFELTSVRRRSGPVSHSGHPSAAAT